MKNLTTEPDTTCQTADRLTVQETKHTDAPRDNAQQPDPRHQAKLEAALAKQRAALGFG